MRFEREDVERLKWLLLEFDRRLVGWKEEEDDLGLRSGEISTDRNLLEDVEGEGLSWLLIEALCGRELPLVTLLLVSLLVSVDRRFLMPTNGFRVSLAGVVDEVPV